MLNSGGREFHDDAALLVGRTMFWSPPLPPLLLFVLGPFVLGPIRPGKDTCSLSSMRFAAGLCVRHAADRTTYKTGNRLPARLQFGSERALKGTAVTP